MTGRGHPSQVSILRVGLLAVLLVMATSCSSEPDDQPAPKPTEQPATPTSGVASSTHETTESSGNPAPAGSHRENVQVEEPAGSAGFASDLDVEAVAAALSVPVRACVQSVDTDHPAFSGCIDWHSAVHGNYALRVASRLIGDPVYERIAQAAATGPKLDAEFAQLRSGAIDHELPYGFAWYLILDREMKTDSSAELAGAIEDLLSQWILDHVDDASVYEAPQYDNMSFAVFSLHRWYSVNDNVQADELERVVALPLIRAATDTCYGSDRRRDEFFDACSNAVLALSQIDARTDSLVDDDELTGFVSALQSEPALDPSSTKTVHAAGLNFSRSWALYQASIALNDSTLISAGDRLVEAHLAMPDFWRENYRSYSHWVAQFGLHALALRQEASDALVDVP